MITEIKNLDPELFLLVLGCKCWWSKGNHPSFLWDIVKIASDSKELRNIVGTEMTEEEFEKYSFDLRDSFSDIAYDTNGKYNQEQIDKFIIFAHEQLDKVLNRLF